MSTDKRINIHNFLFFVLIIFTFTLSSCYDEKFTTDPNYKIEFSTDTLTFDTVFTTIGTATSKILVYNRNKYAIKISNIKLGAGKNSSFRVNVDGELNADNQFSDIELRANDSLYIFVELTVDPTDSISPVFIEDSLVFATNGVVQKVNLQAFGQDMILLTNKYILNDTTLTDSKPYIVYGYLAIDTAKTLTLKPGCKIYFHNNASLICDGNLKAEGTFEKPIVLRGDRLDKIKFETPVAYNNISGQWGGVYLRWDGGKHSLKHVNINSGYFGIYFSNSNRAKLPTLDIAYCKLHNFLLYGLVVENGNVNVSNTEISNSSSYTVYLNGGKHTFVQSTIANYFNNSNVQPAARDKKPAVMIMDLNRIAPMQTVFRNCIISGSSEIEFSIASRYLAQYNGIFDHCYIRRDEPLTSSQFTNNKWYTRNDTIFKSIKYDHIKNTYYNFEPDSISPARGLADLFVASEYPIDLNGNNRMDDSQPDAGAYEWQPTN